MKKKILYITTTYILKNSSAAIRNNSLVKGLVDLGYEVDVCTVKWPTDLSSPFFEREKNGNIHFDQLSNIVRISRMKQTRALKQKNKWITKLRQTLKKVLFFPDECYEWKKGLKWENSENYDCIISSSDHKSSHFAGLKMKQKLSSLPWIQIWGDPWSTDVNTLPFMKAITAYYERKLLKAADYVVYVSNVTMLEMQNKYSQYKNKMYYIPRGFYFEMNSIPQQRHNLIKIVYTGVLTSGRNPFVLLNALKKINAIERKCIVQFYGNIPVDVQEQLRDYPFVEMYESVDFEYMPSIFSSASLLLYLSNKKGSSQIPGKLYDYMGTSRPILCLVSDLSESTSLFLKQFKRCVVIKNSETEIIKNWHMIENISIQNFIPENKFSPRYVASQVMNLLQ